MAVSPRITTNSSLCHLGIQFALRVGSEAVNTALLSINIKVETQPCRYTRLYACSTENEGKGALKRHCFTSFGAAQAPSRVNCPHYFTSQSLPRPNRSNIDLTCRRIRVWLRHFRSATQVPARINLGVSNCQLARAHPIRVRSRIYPRPPRAYS
ncbi:hypothetical protein BDV19DRAFT_332076 [Aspergillus venezuelensis]